MDGGPSTAYVNITSLNSHVSVKNSTFYNGYVSFAVSSPTYCGYDTIINSIIWGGDSLQLETYNDTLTVLYSDIQGGWPGVGNIDVDPLFVYPDTGNFQIGWANWPTIDSTKSPCIDTGDPNSPLDPDSTRADMGALFFNQRPVDIKDIQINPVQYSLLENYPNPFNSSTTIRYTIPTASPVTLDIYDILGRKVQTLLDISQPAGEYRVIWNANKVGSGVYFYRLTTDSNSISRPMILLK
ncbi:MAG: T9SS type A sorting domain-containing protein [candidate division Zixibacteria bacterium]|nr:T9SS type A sorting domain-containing protein [candidate division Zixibacteria bacterium]